MRLAEYLGARLGQPPIEYLRYRLRTMYHCTPSELAEQRGEHFFEMLNDLMCHNWEIRAGNLHKNLKGR